MKHIVTQQRSVEWFRCRSGKPTASNFSKVMMGKQTKTRQDYMCRLVMERVLGRMLDDDGFRSKWMEHGVAMEPMAVADFHLVKGVNTVSCGLLISDDGRYACSPDRIVDQGRMLVEIKCPAPWTHCRYHLYGPGDDYKAQVQGQLLISSYETVYFHSYFPGLPSYTLKTGRDEKYIEKLRIELNAFCDELDAMTEKFVKLGRFDLGLAHEVLERIIPESDVIPPPIPTKNLKQNPEKPNANPQD
jgi:hypothetical protein